MVCSNCNKEISGISYMLSKGIIEVCFDEDGDRYTNAAVIGSSLICQNCISEEIKSKMQETDYNDCINCDIEFKNGDIRYTIYKIKGQTIKTAIGFCENCVPKIAKED